MRRRKLVDDLVGFTDRLLVALWPTSATISRGDDTSTNRSLVPLRAYIELILRRSRATYTTLLAASYYVALLRSAISRKRSTTNRLEDFANAGLLRCQRRMFLAALILASKYTQDRSYSSRAWAKISRLCSKEINANELVFLTAVDWRLHIPHTAFERWVTEVCYYTRLPDLALPDSLLSCIQEDPYQPQRLSLLESRPAQPDIQGQGMSSLSGFTLFSELPTELRAKIWRHVCLTTRVVEIRYDEDENRFVSSSKPPAVLHVSHESRSEALRMYKLCFGTPSAAPHIFFHSGVDKLCLPRRDISLEELGDDRSM